MNKEIAGIHFLQFLQRDGHLTGPCSIRLEIVFVETVKDLMVCKIANLRCIVDKTFMQSPVNGLETNAIMLQRLALKDIL